MRKTVGVILTVMLCAVLAGCGPAGQNEEGLWDCTVACAEKSEENLYVITYSDEKIISETGVLTVENQNDFPVSVHIATEGEPEQVLTLDPGETGAFEKVLRDQVYQAGIHADVEENTEIKVLIRDGK